MQPKRKQITGRGDPPRTLKAAVGQKYRDVENNRAWWMTAHGWERAGMVTVEPRPEQKGAWVVAARQSGLDLEHWVFRTLDNEARLSKANRPPDLPND